MAAISLKPGSKGVMVLIIIAASIFVGCVLAYVGVAGKMKSTASEYQAKLKKVEESKEIAQKLEKSKLDYQDTLSQIRFLETSVSTEAYVPTLLKQIEQLSSSVNLQVTQVQPAQEEAKTTTRSASSGAKAADGNVEDASKTKETPGSARKKEIEKPYDEINVALEFKGKYTNVLDFLYRLTSFPKILAVKSVSITPADGSTLSYKSSPMLSVNMTVTAFVLKKDDPVHLPVMPEPAVTTTTSAAGKGADNEAG